MVNHLLQAAAGWSASAGRKGSGWTQPSLSLRPLLGKWGGGVSPWLGVKKHITGLLSVGLLLVRMGHPALLSTLLGCYCPGFLRTNKTCGIREHDIGLVCHGCNIAAVVVQPGVLRLVLLSLQPPPPRWDCGFRLQSCGAGICHNGALCSAVGISGLTLCFAAGD